MRALVAPLFVPATRPDRFAKAAASGADAVIVDLEDAVAPADKAAARANLRSALALPIPVIVRINPNDTEWHNADLRAVAELGPAFVCVPKAQSAAVLDRIAEAVNPGTRLVALIETARALAGAMEIAGHPAVFQLAFGPADFFLDMGMRPSPAMAGQARRTLAIASRAAGLPRPLDGPTFEIGDAVTLTADCEAAIGDGAGGKLCIHPSQVMPVRAAFMPTAAEIERARAIVSADRNGAAQIVDGAMVDAAIVADARALLDRAGDQGDRRP